MAAEKIQKLFRASMFFRPDFSFCVERQHHTPEQYNEQYSCRREFWKIIYVLKGEGWKVINEQRYPIRPGSLFLIHPLDKTTFIIEAPEIEIYNILFLPALVAAGLKDLKNDFNFFSIFNDQLDPQMTPESREQLYVLDSSRDIETLIRRIEREYQRQAYNYQSIIKLQLLELLILIGRLSVRKVCQNRHRDIVSFIASVIDKHYQEEFDFEYLAREIGVSQSHMCRLYRAATGGTISQSLLERRLAAARERLLKYPDRNISEICYECGFNDLSHFYRVFTQATGLNPGRFRKNVSSDRQ